MSNQAFFYRRDYRQLAKNVSRYATDTAWFAPTSQPDIRRYKQERQSAAPDPSHVSFHLQLRAAK
ncbi:hypothetical protein ACFUTU_00455 [Arthrobacter sp. NPDC057388]|uniref:hypothetical protein n=1 Tax=Arthrobacter sp. NPDC057388 TaxID=3346116 RepID=UPI00363E1E7F